MSKDTEASKGCVCVCVCVYMFPHQDIQIWTDDNPIRRTKYHIWIENTQFRFSIPNMDRKVYMVTNSPNQEFNVHIRKVNHQKGKYSTKIGTLCAACVLLFASSSVCVCVFLFSVLLLLSEGKGCNAVSLSVGSHTNGVGGTLQMA